MKVWFCAVIAAAMLFCTASCPENAEAESIDIQLPVSFFQMSKPQVIDDVLYYIGSDSLLYALDLQGNVKWTSSPLQGDRFSPLTADGSGNLYCVSNLSGELILYFVGSENSDFWQETLGGYNGAPPRAPVIDGDSILVVSGDGKVYTINKQTRHVDTGESTQWWYSVTDAKNSSGVGMLVSGHQIRLFVNKDSESSGSLRPPGNFGMVTEPNVSPPQNVQITD